MRGRRYRNAGTCGPVQDGAVIARKRGEMSRLEAFFDAVFAFALTLLVVSLEVPHSYDELLATLHNFLAFAITFAALVWIWWQHYVFFHGYGLNDAVMVTLNAALLFVVLLYVYPLKFLCQYLVDHLLGIRHRLRRGLRRVLPNAPVRVLAAARASPDAARALRHAVRHRGQPHQCRNGSGLVDHRGGRRRVVGDRGRAHLSGARSGPRGAWHVERPTA